MVRRGPSTFFPENNRGLAAKSTILLFVCFALFCAFLILKSSIPVFSIWMQLFCLQLEASCLQMCFLLTIVFGSFFAYNLSFFTYSGSFVLTIGASLLTVKKCIQEVPQQTVSKEAPLSKKAPTVSKKTSP